jgi:hypothetical protein
MGSGSYGGGGGGGSGSGGSGGGGGGGESQRGYKFKDQELVSQAQSAGAIAASIAQIFGSLSRDAKSYEIKQFCSPLIVNVFEALFRFPIAMQDRSWKIAGDLFNVDDRPGCLVRWVDKLIASIPEPDRRIRETARVCLEDFLVTALRNDTDLYFQGSGAQIISALDPNVFKRTANRFLGWLIFRVLERERERVPAVKEAALRQAGQNLADSVVGAFEQKFHGKNQVTYRQLFRVFSENSDWLRERLRSGGDQ